MIEQHELKRPILGDWSSVDPVFCGPGVEGYHSGDLLAFTSIHCSGDAYQWDVSLLRLGGSATSADVSKLMQEWGLDGFTESPCASAKCGGLHFRMTIPDTSG